MAEITPSITATSWTPRRSGPCPGDEGQRAARRRQPDDDRQAVRSRREPTGPSPWLVTFMPLFWSEASRAVSLAQGPRVVDQHRAHARGGALAEGPGRPDNQGEEAGRCGVSRRISWTTRRMARPAVRPPRSPAKRRNAASRLCVTAGQRSALPRARIRPARTNKARRRRVRLVVTWLDARDRGARSASNQEVPQNWSGSTPTVGSSRNSTGGRCTSAQASDSRRRRRTGVPATLRVLSGHWPDEMPSVTAASPRMPVGRGEEPGVSPPRSARVDPVALGRTPIRARFIRDGIRTPRTCGVAGRRAGHPRSRRISVVLPEPLSRAAVDPPGRVEAHAVHGREADPRPPAPPGSRPHIPTDGIAAGFPRHAHIIMYPERRNSSSDEL